MAIDTAAKRNSAICTRRLPWMRRFSPIPSGSITQADRQQLGYTYIGILVTSGLGSTGWFAKRSRNREVVWLRDRGDVVWGGTPRSRNREVVWKAVMR